MADEGEQIAKEGGSPKPFFSKGEGEPTAASGHAGLKPGSEIGPYKLLGTLGEGGYGMVYLAQQERPIRRRVALKVIKPGMDSKQVIVRFEAERQALALLDHANLAHVYDAGTTQAGRPYFAMEYIEGTPITEYCDREKLSIKDRLRLFLQVCSAVQHAHQKGIIHRDLKPSNILVTVKDQEPTVKVIDFGIVKALDQPLTERTLHTEHGQFIGTPDYMSPEQAEMDSQGVDTRSDIYSLGVVLYELLAGVLPFDPQELRACGVNQIRTVICDREPRTPSTRLTALGEKAIQLARERQTNAQELVKCLHRELEWMPLTAMRKEASRRYQSAAELASDVENYLRGAPLLAGPESTAYRIRKFVQRHRNTVTFAAAIAILLITALVATSALYFRAEKLRGIADNSRAVAEEERDRAVRIEEQAKLRLADFYEEQGRRYAESGDLDRAIVLLSHALRTDPTRASTHLLAHEAIRRHPDPNLRIGGVVAWQDPPPPDECAFSTSPDRKYAAFVNTKGGTISVFNTETRALRLRCNIEGILRLIIVPGNDYMLANVHDTASRHKILVMDMASGETVGSIGRTNASLERILTVLSGKVVTPAILRKYYSRIVLSRDGAWFAFLDCDSRAPTLESWASVWDFAGNELRSSARYGVDEWLCGLIYRPPSPYGFVSVLVGVNCDGFCYLWHVPEFDLADRFRFEATDGIISRTRTVYLNLNGDLVLLDRAGNRVIQTFRNIAGYGLNHDGTRLVTARVFSRAGDREQGTEDPSADLWDTADGSHIEQLPSRNLANWHFSPDGRFLITESDEHQVSVWYAHDGQLVFTIAREEDQEVVDISPESTWLVTRGRKEEHLVNVWKLSTGARFQPYVADSGTEDAGSGWAMAEVDRVFACSRRTPQAMPRFNATGSALITRTGLLPFLPDPAKVQNLIRMIDAYIPLRLDSGRIRPASEEETQLARLRHFGSIGAERSPEAIECLLEVVSHALTRHDLTAALQFMKRYSALLPIEPTQLAERGRKIRRELADAYFDLGDREERGGRHASALTHYGHTLHLQPEHGVAWNRSAWIRATSPNPRLRDVEEALAQSRRACELTGWEHWEYLSTYAVACAACSDYAQAKRSQQKAIELLPPSQQRRWMKNFQQRLRLFASSQPYDNRLFHNLPNRTLLYWWDFDDPDEKVARDRSGNQHDLRLTGEVQKVRDDRGNVLHFHGTADVACYHLPDARQRDALTVTAWIKFEPPDKAGPAHSAIVSNGHAWALAVSGDTHTLVLDCIGLDVPDAEPFSRVSGNIQLGDALWHHVAGVYDGDSLSLFVDGGLDSCVPAHGRIITSLDPICVGRREQNVVSDWRGLIDDVRIYNRALRAEEITMLYDQTR